MKKQLIGFFIGLAISLSLGAGAIVFKIPPGITPDNSAAFGLFGLMQNINNLAPGPESAIVTSGTASTMTTAQLLTGIITLDAGASGGFTLTLPSTASIISSFGPTVITDGTFAKMILIKNDGVGQTGTLTAGDASTTVTGTATIASNTTRMFMMFILSPTTIEFENMGSLSL
jgi:hypothetical protein